MRIDKTHLDNLCDEARKSPRLRMNYDLRTTPEDNSQRMLNALQMGTEMPVHRHSKTSATVVVLRGSIRQNFYDDACHLEESVVLKAGSDCVAAQIEKGRWHNLECLEPDTVIFEAKDGKWEEYEK